MNNALEQRASYDRAFGSRHRCLVAEFFMEMFDDGKWQRERYFNFIFGIVAQFLLW